MFPGLVGARANIMRAVNKGLVFPMTGEQAAAIRGFTMSLRFDIAGRRKWIRGEVKAMNLGLSVKFEEPENVDLITAFINVMAAIDGGDDTQAKAYTQDMAKAWLAYIHHLNNESDFLLEVQRLTVEQKRRMSDES